MKINVARLKQSSRASSPRASIESSSLYSFPTARNVNLPTPTSPFEPERYQPAVMGPPPSYGMTFHDCFCDCTFKFERFLFKIVLNKRIWNGHNIIV